MFQHLFFCWLIPCGLFLAMSSCGYRFSGSSAASQDFERLFISLFENQTAETGIDVLITDDLKNEFIYNYSGRLVERGDATAVLSGKITEVRSWTVSRRGALTSLERRIRVSVDVKLEDAAGKTIRSVPGVSATETYAVVSEDKQATEQNRDQAILLLSKQIAEAVFHRLTEDF